MCYYNSVFEICLDLFYGKLIWGYKWGNSIVPLTLPSPRWGEGKSYKVTHDIVTISRHSELLANKKIIRHSESLEK